MIPTITITTPIDRRPSWEKNYVKENKGCHNSVIFSTRKKILDRWEKEEPDQWYSLLDHLAELLGSWVSLSEVRQGDHVQLIAQIRAKYPNQTIEISSDGVIFPDKTESDQ